VQTDASIEPGFPEGGRTETLKKISSGKKMHDAEILGWILKDLGFPIPVRLVRKFRRAGWSTALRYETGRSPTGETRAFVKTAKAVYDWVEGQLS
jgi:hypothetical protein